MKVITYYPATNSTSDSLKTQVAKVHINAVVHHINQLPCPTSQKMLLLEAISQDRKNLK